MELKSLHEVLGFEDSLVRAATSLCGGTAFQLVGMCGGLAGGIMVQDEFKKFEEAGAHTDPQKCVRIVGNAARWVMEILIDRGVVQLT